MPSPKIAPYGAWKSPISAEKIAAASLRLGEVTVCDGTIYWTELRPSEDGRCTVMRRAADGTTADVVPPPFNVRTRVHEYGGGAYLVAGRAIYFSNFSDQRLYCATGNGAPTPVTPEAKARYADGVFDARRERLILVREDHAASSRDAVTTIVSVDPSANHPGDVLISGNDFYAAPRLNARGDRLAWLTWNHPQMPWEGAELWTARVDGEGKIDHPEHVAGGKHESALQPKWGPDGTLYFICDRTNWWNLYRRRDGEIEALCEVAADFARPPWVLGASTYDFVNDTHIVCTYFHKGRWRLARINMPTGHLRHIRTNFTDLDDLQTSDGRVYCIAASPTKAPSVVGLDISHGAVDVVRRSAGLKVHRASVSRAAEIAFPSAGNRTAYAYYYAPVNPGFKAPDDEKPPLLVLSHGGPTSAAAPSLNLRIQYYTSRGFAVLDVNYGGSTGYGRAYRKQLDGEWGIVDVDDCCNGARYLVERGLADANRLAIKGGSAGGYTTLCALAFRDTFHAGASHFGVGDCEVLARETHKFESHYLDTLIAPYPAQRALYIERSPAHHVEKLSCPIIFFQGLDDAIVPPNQAEMMVDALRRKGMPVAYVPFEGEQHGFRRASSIRRALEAELYFFGRIFRFDPADDIEPVTIDNLPAR